MSSQSKGRSPRLKITRNAYGYSISIKSKRPEDRYLPPDPGEVKRAIKDMKTKKPKKLGQSVLHR
jgi:hypothetical protein